MSVTPVCLFESSFSPASAASAYASPAATRTIVDKFTVVNTDSSTRTISVWILPSGISAVADQYRIVNALSLVAGAYQEVSEMKNHILETGDAIWTAASVTSKVSHRASGRKVT